MGTAKRATAQLATRPAKAAVMDLVERAPAFLGERSLDGQGKSRRDATGPQTAEAANGPMTAHKLVQLIGWIAQNGSPATFNSLLNSC
jgi:hypothetical protein